MRYLLAKRHLPTLAHFASSHVMLAFDYDGTLAPITIEPSQAHLRARTRRLLSDVAQRYPCVVISGRRRDDVTNRLKGISVRDVFGNHGLEPWSQDVAYANRVRIWLAHLERRLPSCTGLIVEDKTYSVAIHYRAARQKRLVVQAINGAVLGLQGSRVLGGKEAVNLVPRNAPHKGRALERARRLLACNAVVYVGDDETDEDAFGAAPPERLLSVRIGAARTSRAHYYLKSQSEINALLRMLIRLRPSLAARLD
jgi:trehalose 6-phosphate phosphatase